MPKIHTFTEDGGNLFLGRVEYWDEVNGEIYFFSKVFLDAESRNLWVYDRKRALRLVGPIPPNCAVPELYQELLDAA